MNISRPKHPLFLAFVFTAAIIVPPALQAAPGDQNWDFQFGVPGTTNNTLAITTQNGTLYVGGFNNSATTNTPLNYWDGFQWETLGTFNNGNNQAIIQSAAFVGNTLYVGGAFTNVNGVAANGLAAWNGSTWSSIGFKGGVVSLAVSGNNLYVGGIFTNLDSGGVTMTNVGYWDGSAWHAMGGGLGIPGNSQVIKLLVNGSSVYAGGLFTGSGSITVSNLAAWNGTNWQAVGSGINGAVEGLGYNGGILYAGGTFSAPASFVAQWNGTSWSGMGSGMNGVVSSIAIFNNQVCAAGSFTLAGGITCSNFGIWNGSSWSPAGNGLTASASRTYSTGTNVYVSGNFGGAGNIYANAIASWDGNQWNAIGTPGRTNGVPNTVYAMGNDGNNIYAGGAFTYAGIIGADYVARFDGKKWNPMGTGVAGTTTPTVRAIAVTNNNVYVGGSFSTAGGAGAANMAQWDGANWHALGSGPGGQVYGIAAAPSGVYAVGAPQGASLYGSPFFEVWNGTSWASCEAINSTNEFFALPFNTPGPAMQAVAVMGTNIFVGGANFYVTTITPPQSSQGILRYDGTYCYPVGSGFNTNVVALAVISTNLYAAGNFTNAGGNAASHIAMWNGINWTNLGSGVVGPGSVLSLGTMGNYLFAGGSFTNMGGVAASGIAEWDGTNWYALGSGVTFVNGGIVEGMTSVGSDLYVGGACKYAGGKLSFDVGHWNNQVNFNTPQLSNPVKENTGLFGVTLSGVNGLTNIIQATTNFVSWTPVFTNTVGICIYTDSVSATYPYRFYRATLGGP